MVFTSYRLNVKVAIDKECLLAGVVTDSAEYKGRQRELYTLHRLRAKIDALCIDAVLLQLVFEEVPHRKYIVPTVWIAGDADEGVQLPVRPHVKIKILT